MPAQPKSLPSATVTEEGGVAVVALRGSWRFQNLRDITSLEIPSAKELIVDGSQLEELDTAGAFLIIEQIAATTKTTVRAFSAEHEAVFRLVAERMPKAATVPAPRWNPLAQIGEATVKQARHVFGLLSFVGQTCHETLRSLLNPRKFRKKEFVTQVEQTCIDAIPVICLVMVLIGFVIAYLFSVQLERYGANIFVADGVGLAICRELSPVIVAIIVAGRSGSAFTAQIGSMKMNEEVDALKALGLSPLQVLVVPRFLALGLAIPLLVFVGDILGILGGMIVADLRLGVTIPTFLDRLRDTLSYRSFLIGMVKAPVFALFISSIGCRMGLEAEENAASVGASTTSTVVQCIVAVILLDAAFAVICSELKI